jgi:hypothetical protein
LPASDTRLLNVTGTVFGASVSSLNNFFVNHVLMISANKIVLFPNKKRRSIKSCVPIIVIMLLLIELLLVPIGTIVFYSLRQLWNCIKTASYPDRHNLSI